jgi:hypothetical protein
MILFVFVAWLRLAPKDGGASQDSSARMKLQGHTE